MLCQHYRTAHDAFHLVRSKCFTKGSKCYSLFTEEGGSIYQASGLSDNTPVLCGSKPDGYPKTGSAVGSTRLVLTSCYNDTFLCIIIFKLLKLQKKKSCHLSKACVIQEKVKKGFSGKLKDQILLLERVWCPYSCGTTGWNRK